MSARDTRDNPSLADIYRELGEVHTKVTLIIDDRAAQKREHNALAGRVRKLEGWKSWVLGVAAGVSAAVSYALGGKH